MSGAGRRSAAVSSRYRLAERAGGGWAVTGPHDRCGGLFADRPAAVRFIRDEHRARAACGSDTAAATVEVLAAAVPGGRRAAVEIMAI